MKSFVKRLFCCHNYKSFNYLEDNEINKYRNLLFKVKPFQEMRKCIYCGNIKLFYYDEKYINFIKE